MAGWARPAAPPTPTAAAARPASFLPADISLVLRDEEAPPPLRLGQMNLNLHHMPSQFADGPKLFWSVPNLGITEA